MLNTDWEDDGEAINAVKWHADAWAAECAWNASATPIEDFNRRLGAVLFGEEGGQCAALWLAENRPYALDWTMARYTNVVKEYDALLARVAVATDQARAGRRVPAPEETGLAMPIPIARRIQPREIHSTTLEPNTPWADSTATHRLGLTVHAGATDRFELPVEIEATMPSALVSKPVRAFRADEPGKPQELLVQLDPLGDSKTWWSVKFNSNKLALGLVTPETAARHRIGPGSGAGGAGIENSPPAQHFVTFGGVLEHSAAETMNRLQSTLDLNRPISVSVYVLQAKPSPSP